MAPQREIDKKTAGGQLALFLVWLTRGATVRELAERFEPSRATWGNYLNGSQLIPKPVLKDLLEAFTAPGPARNTAVRDAWERWTAADAERRSARATPGREVVRQHQRLEDALEQVIKYQKFAGNAEQHLAELRLMLAYTESRLEKTELELQLAGERERARAELRLGQARERLGRVRIQQERARGRRMTAEEQQDFWMTEALNAQEEISRLERETQDLIVVPQGLLPPVRQDTADEVDDAAFEARLEHITAEGLEDEALIEEDLQPAHDPDGPPLLLVVQDAVQLVSKTVLDKAATSSDTDRQAALALVARTLHAAGPARLAPALHAAGPARLVPAQRAAAAPGPSRILLKRSLNWLGLTYEPHLNPNPGPAATSRFLEPAQGAPAFRTVKALKAWLGYLPDGDFNAFAPWARVLGALLLTCTATGYLFGQDRATQLVSVNDRLGNAFAATVFCLVPLYSALRFLKIPNAPARILAPALHLAWIILMLLDLFPWKAPHYSNQ
ncbi:hypothetical protein [Streptomyces sp. NPDC093093]|uniref:hypothetical protein n=1 Tax=Streptomyces sp. NPDC093093 TaxID=3366025 RepID=UPI0037F86C25